MNGIYVFGIVNAKMTVLLLLFFLLIFCSSVVGMVRAPRRVELRRGPSARLLCQDGSTVVNS